MNQLATPQVNLRHMRSKYKRWVEVFADGLKVAGIYCKPNGDRIVYHPLSPNPKRSSANNYDGSRAHAQLAFRLLDATDLLPVGPRQPVTDPNLLELAIHIRRLLARQLHH